MFREGPEGFKGVLGAGNYNTIIRAPTATTTRDLADLMGKGALIRTGKRRLARYWLKLKWQQSGSSICIIWTYNRAFYLL